MSAARAGETPTLKAIRRCQLPLVAMLPAGNSNRSIRRLARRLSRAIVESSHGWLRMRGRAEAQRTQLYHRVRKFMERYEFFVLPVSQVLPFSVDTPYLREIDGVPLHSYIDWMKSCYYISTVGNPALSVPCAFSASGLPVGLQIVGRHQDDWGVLQLGHAFEAATNLWRRRPPGM